MGDCDTINTINQQLEAIDLEAVDLLATHLEQSCLMAYIESCIDRTTYVIFDIDTPMLRLLLDTAAERGQVRDLLAIEDGQSMNVFHELSDMGSIPQILLDTLARANRSPITPAGILPADICELIRSFLPNPLDQLCNTQAQVEGRPFGMTPIMFAACNDEPFTVRQLVDAGANPNLTNTFGMTALDIMRSRETLMILDEHVDRAHWQRAEVISYLESITDPAAVQPASASSAAAVADPPAETDDAGWGCTIS